MAPIGLLAQGDYAMYNAKRRGANLVSFAIGTSHPAATRKPPQEWVKTTFLFRNIPKWPMFPDENGEVTRSCSGELFTRGGGGFSRKAVSNP